MTWVCELALISETKTGRPVQLREPSKFSHWSKGDEQVEVTLLHPRPWLTTFLAMATPPAAPPSTSGDRVLARLSRIVAPPTQDSITSLSSYLVLNDASVCAMQWMVAVETLTPQQMLPLLYLASDLLLRAKGEPRMAYIVELAKYLPAALKVAIDRAPPADAVAIARLPKLWGERGVFSANFSGRLCGIVDTAAASSPNNAAPSAPETASTPPPPSAMFDLDSTFDDNGSAGADVSSLLYPYENASAAADATAQAAATSGDGSNGAHAASGLVSQALAEAQRRHRVDLAASMAAGSIRPDFISGDASVVLAATAAAAAANGGEAAAMSALSAQLAVAERSARLVLAAARLNVKRRTAFIERISAAIGETQSGAAAPEGYLAKWEAAEAELRGWATAAAAGKTLRIRNHADVASPSLQTMGDEHGDYTTERGARVHGSDGSAAVYSPSKPLGGGGEGGGGAGTRRLRSASGSQASTIDSSNGGSVGGDSRFRTYGGTARADGSSDNDADFDPLMSGWGSGSADQPMGAFPISAAVASHPAAEARAGTGSYSSSAVAGSSSLDDTAATALETSPHAVARARGSAAAAGSASSSPTSSSPTAYSAAASVAELEQTAARNAGYTSPSFSGASSTPTIAGVGSGGGAQLQRGNSGGSSGGGAPTLATVGAVPAAGSGRLFHFEDDAAFAGYVFNPAAGGMVKVDDGSGAEGEESWRDT